MNNEDKLQAFLSTGTREVKALGITLRPHTANTAAQLELARVSLRQRLQAMRKELGADGGEALRDASVYYGAANVAFIHSHDCQDLVWKPAAYWKALSDFMGGFVREQFFAAIPDLAEHLAAADKVQDWKIDDSDGTPNSPN